MIIMIGVFEIEIPETVNSIKKYQLVEIGENHWRKGFTETRRLGTRFAIKTTMANSWSVTNLEDMELFVKYYLNLS